LGLLGAVSGCVLGWIILYFLNMAKITFNFGQQQGLILMANVQATDLLTISITVIVVSVIASLQPAFKASRLEPIEALRHV
jgi:putative ABC transport system permease protein